MKRIKVSIERKIRRIRSRKQNTNENEVILAVVAHLHEARRDIHKIDQVLALMKKLINEESKN